MDTSKLGSIEAIKEYLESDLGIDIFVKVYPIIKQFGDDILFLDNLLSLKDQLKGLLSPDQVEKYHIYFSTLVFYELEIEKANQSSIDKQNQKDNHD